MAFIVLTSAHNGRRKSVKRAHCVVSGSGWPSPGIDLHLLLLLLLIV